MELELRIFGEDGYISTLSNGTSLVCTPVSKNDIENAVDEFQKNKKYRVASFGSSNGDQRHVIKEVIERDFQSNSSSDKIEIELSRHKQDCRKRALDLAHMQRPQIMDAGGWTPSAKDILEMADVYYQWLIKNQSDEK